EAACSRFRPETDISRVNAAAGSPTVVGPVLIDALTAAIELARMTAGLSDPTLGAAVIAAGYDRSFEEIEAGGPGRILMAAPGGARDRVANYRQASTVTVPSGFDLDLGGSAKGWAVHLAPHNATTSLLPRSPRA